MGKRVECLVTVEFAAYIFIVNTEDNHSTSDERDEKEVNAHGAVISIAGQQEADTH